ncbi:NlpC/P60 family protein [Actinomyces slackii]|uniref:NlpC/P60 domain-containing protein n=1 Tax=Actinomyces slackii TaxID=52774 RepID=A0A3S4UN19_9ACTO|nr:NlpC/P60 family protein [Actinomyces slackii]VEG74349.1 Uncharacterised protein [Actinomyces slackii]
MADNKPNLRRGAAMAATALLASSLIAPAAMAGPAGGLPASQSSGSRFDTTADMQQATGLSGTVTTAGDEFADDGSGMTYTISTTQPTGPGANVALPLADGSWAMPQNLPSAPTTQPNAAAAEDMIARGQTFVDAGTQLEWDGSRVSPLSGKVIHQEQEAPYAVSCSTFVGMTLVGWNYQSSTYTADKNSVVGYSVDFGQNPEGSGLWQANNLASWFYANGDMWYDTEGHYQRGDVLFFSSPTPTVRPGTGAGSRSTFANVYHVAIYLGDGMLMHSTGKAAGQGVHISKMGESLKAELSFVARPNWTGTKSSSVDAGASGAQAGAQPASDQGAAAASQEEQGEQAAQAEQSEQAAQAAEEQTAAEQTAAAQQAHAQAKADVPEVSAEQVEGDAPAQAQTQAQDQGAKPAAQAAAGQESRLPSTGASVAGILLAVLLVGGGVGLMLFRRLRARGGSSPSASSGE